MEGNFVASWEDDRDEYCDVFARQYSNEGMPLGDDFRVNDDTSVIYHYRPTVSADNEGNFLIVWEDQRFGFNSDIFAQPYLNDGTTVGNNYKINDDVGSANQRIPSIAVDSNNNFIVVWIDNRNGHDDIFAQRFSGNGAAIGNNFRVNDDSSYYSINYRPSVACDDEGNFVIAWDDYRIEYWGDIFAQRYSKDGTALGTNFKVNDVTSVVYGATVACKKNGDFIITWGDAPYESLERFRTGQLNMGKDVVPDLLTGKDYSKPDIWAQQYLSDGTALGTNFMVNDDVGSTEQTCPAITVNSNGDFIIAWQDNRNGDWDIYLQPYLSNGTPVGANLKVVDSIVSYYTWGSSISSDDNGNFIITWRDNRNGDYDIWAQRFSNDFTPVGYNFLVNNNGVGANQSSTCVSADGFGNFIICWTDHRDGNKDVYAQRYLSDGTPFGSNYLISNTGELEQSFPAVALRNNRIYTTWQDNRSGQTGFDVWANVWNWEHGIVMENELLSGKSQMPCLHQNYPNPFDGFTTISYTMNEPDFVTLNIYDVCGREIKSLVNEFQNAESHAVIVDGNEL